MRLRAAPQYLDTLFLGALVVLLAVSLGLLGYVVLLRGDHARRVHRRRQRDPARGERGRRGGRRLDLLPPEAGHAARARGLRRGDVDPRERVLVRLLHPDRRGPELPDRRRPRVRGGLPLPDRRVPGGAPAQPPPRVGCGADRRPPGRCRALAGRRARREREDPDHPRHLRALRRAPLGRRCSARSTATRSSSRPPLVFALAHLFNSLHSTLPDPAVGDERGRRAGRDRVLALRDRVPRILEGGEPA